MKETMEITRKQIKMCKDIEKSISGSNELVEEINSMPNKNQKEMAVISDELRNEIISDGGVPRGAILIESVPPSLPSDEIMICVADTIDPTKQKEEIVQIVSKEISEVLSEDKYEFKTPEQEEAILSIEKGIAPKVGIVGIAGMGKSGRINALLKSKYSLKDALKKD